MKLHHNPDILKLIFAGPFCLLLLTGLLAVVILLAIAFRRPHRVSAWIVRASLRVERGQAIPLLWGVSAAVLFPVAAAVMFSTKALALLGIIVLFAGLILAALGLCAASLRIGRELDAFSGNEGGDDFTAFQRGLGAAFLASCLPFIGWIVVLLELVKGIGALLETSLTHPE